MADTTLELQTEMDRAQELAERYRFEFVDLRSQNMDSCRWRHTTTSYPWRWVILLTSTGWTSWR